MRLEPIGRRAALRALLAVAPATLLTQQTQPASAFANSLPPDELMLKYPSPKTPGPKPGDIGPRDGGALKPCIDGKPHCFSSSAETFDDEFNAGELPEDAPRQVFTRAVFTARRLTALTIHNIPLGNSIKSRRAEP